MRLIKLLGAFLLVVTVFTATAQQQGANWFFGEGLGLRFEDDSVMVQSGGRTGNTYINIEGTATISDGDGNLLFYSDGERVWDRLHRIMPNGYGLGGEQSATHAAVIVPFPADPNRYYLFTASSFLVDFAGGINYSVVDVCLNRGTGDILPGQKSIHLLDTGSEKMTLVKHANGSDYWLVVVKHFTNEYYAYRISADGIAAPVVSRVGPVHGPLGGNALGQMKASPDGRRIAWVAGNSLPGVATLLSFDNRTGVLSDPIVLTPASGQLYGVSFSPGSNRLYISVSSFSEEIDVFNIANNTTAAAINASMQTIAAGYVMSMQLGLDGRLYFSRADVPVGTGAFIGRINFPDRPLPDCDVDARFLPIDNGNDLLYAFPTFLDNYAYANTTPDCRRGFDVTLCDLQMPTAFSPNGDGQNDVFRMLYRGRQDEVVFRIFDRWGRRVFETSDPLVGWDGQYRGVASPVGVYYYFVQYRCASGERREKKGDVMLVR